MDALTIQLGEALERYFDVSQHPQLFNSSERGNCVYQAQKALRAYHEAQAAEREARLQDDCGIGQYLSEAE